MKELTTRFTSYELTDEETLRGSVLSLEQKWYIQNKLAEAANEKSALKLDPNDVLPYAQQEAFLAGQVELCEFLLENSDASEEALQHLHSAAPDENL